MFDIGLLHHFKELPRIGAERFHITPLPFGIDRIEREAGLAGTGKPGNDNQLVARKIDIDTLEIVFTGTTDGNGCKRHEGDLGSLRAGVQRQASGTLWPRGCSSNVHPRQEIEQFPVHCTDPAPAEAKSWTSINRTREEKRSQMIIAHVRPRRRDGKAEPNYRADTSSHIAFSPLFHKSGLSGHAHKADTHHELTSTNSSVQ